MVDVPRSIGFLRMICGVAFIFNGVVGLDGHGVLMVLDVGDIHTLRSDENGLGYRGTGYIANSLNEQNINNLMMEVSPFLLSVSYVIHLISRIPIRVKAEPAKQ